MWTVALLGNSPFNSSRLSGFTTRCWMTRFNGPSAVGRVVAFFGNLIQSALGNVELQTSLLELFSQVLDLNVDDAADLIAL